MKVFSTLRSDISDMIKALDDAAGKIDAILFLPGKRNGN